MIETLDYVSFVASFGLLFAVRRWVATGETFWIVLLVGLCLPGWAHEIGWI